MPLEVGYRGRMTALPIPQSDHDEWESTLKSMMSAIYNSLLTRIATSTEFLNKIATPSSEAWADFVNPNWEDADFIKLKQRVKLSIAYPSWKQGVENAFGEGGYFADRVTSKKMKFSMVKYTLGAVGLRYQYGRGIAVKAIGVISGMKRVKHDIRSTSAQPTVSYYDPQTGQVKTEPVTIPADEFQGNIINVFPTGVARFARSLTVPILTQGLVLAQLANEHDLTTERDNIISVVNSYLQNSVLKLVDTANHKVWFGLAVDEQNNIVVCVESSTTDVTSPIFCSELGA